LQCLLLKKQLKQTKKCKFICFYFIIHNIFISLIIYCH
jgi:hypothetical protein